MRILHVLDHSIPLHSGYTFRTAAILREQRALGWETFHLTSPKQGKTGAPVEDVDGLRFHRSEVPPPGPAGLNEWRLIRATEARLLQLARELRPDVIHAHSPVLNAIPAIRVGRKLGIPVVYEIRAFWEDAAVDHGTTSEGSLRYRATRALETWAIKRVDHVFTICEGLRRDILARGIAESKVTVIPNAVDVDVVLEGRVELGDGVVIGPFTRLKDVTLAAGTQVRAHCDLEGVASEGAALIGPYARLRPGTVLADGVHVGNFVETKNARIGMGSKANHLTYLGDAVIGTGTNIGAGTITCNYDGVNKSTTTIGDRVFVGSNSSLVAPVTLADGATIGAGSVISKNAPADKLTVARARQMTVEGWQRPMKK